LDTNVAWAGLETQGLKRTLLDESKNDGLAIGIAVSAAVTPHIKITSAAMTILMSRLNMMISPELVGA
jgi:hypothetical protein